MSTHEKDRTPAEVVQDTFEILKKGQDDPEAIAAALALAAGTQDNTPAD